MEWSIISVEEANEIIEPVTVNEVKKWANIDHEDDDILIAGMITGAREDVEKYTNLKLVDTTVELHASCTKCSEEVPLQYGKPSDVVVKNLKGETLTINDDYLLSGRSVYPSREGKYVITYGIVNPNIPRSLRNAVMMLVTYRYNNRGDQDKQQGIPQDIISVIHPFRKEAL